MVTTQSGSTLPTVDGHWTSCEFLVNCSVYSLTNSGVSNVVTLIDRHLQAFIEQPLLKGSGNYWKKMILASC